MKNKKGFTLIELLAVIIILGVLMLIAIPSVTAYINNSKKNSYIDSAKNYIRGATVLINNGKLDMFDLYTTYYIPIKCIPLETGGESPFGKFEQAYVVVSYNNDFYRYYWLSRDSQGMGIPKLVVEDKLTSDLIKAGLKADDIKPNTPIGKRTTIAILNEDNCTDFELGEVKEKHLSFDINFDVDHPGVGDTAHFVAHIEGWENLEYDMFWEWSTDNVNYNRFEGENGPTMDLVITSENINWWYRFSVRYSKD